MSASKQGPELLEQLAKHIATALAEANIEAERADLIGCEIAQRISNDWGGQLIYVPKDTLARTSRKHQQIWDEFKGNNYGELARKHGLALPWIYAVIKRMRKQYIKRTQRDMFDDDDDFKLE